VRYGYALTAHRAQGSTYETVFIDQEDILSNPTKAEGGRCFYVAATRASKRIYTL
jgi:ATP-dependent exoDNAse (exonuclease V) alpha subunit